MRLCVIFLTVIPKVKMFKISKNMFICLLALIANGCSFMPQSQNSPLTKSATCPDKPVESLLAADVKNITLNEIAVKESGLISAGKMKGFTFKAKSGQQLKYKTGENLCIWVFAQDNQLITGKTLNSDGNYTLQITAPQGSTTFDLDISLDANDTNTVTKPVNAAIASPQTIDGYQINSCGSILDKKTNLEWYIGSDRNMTWDDSKKWIDNLNTCSTKWRMPTIDELQTLYDPKYTAGTGYSRGGRSFPAHIHPVFARIGGGSWVWSNESLATEARSFNFNQAVVTQYSRNETSYSTRAFAVKN
jgi:hypothetical protein